MRKNHFTTVFRLFWLCTAVAGCATYQTQYTGNHSFEEIKIQPSDIRHTFFLVGDAGLAQTQERVLGHLADEASSVGKNSTLLFLGDNIYEKGMPDKKHPDRKAKETILQNQIDAARNFAGNAIFIPGNHDWYSGLKGLKDQQKFVEDALGKNSFLPKNGCPIQRVKIGNDIVLLVIDSQWYITNWDKHPTMNDDCVIKTRADFWDEVSSEIKKAVGKTTLIAVHHPMLSDGAHGGQYDAKSHFLPLPVLGTLKNAIRKTGGVSNADMQNKMYNDFIEHLSAYSQFNDRVIFLSGHDHSQQFIQKNSITQIISGAGAKQSATRLTNGSQFSSSDLGFARLDVLADGSSVVRFYSSDTKQPIFTATIFEPLDNTVYTEFITVADTVKAKIYPDRFLDKSDKYQERWGKRYRRYFGMDIAAPAVNLENYLGGLEPVRKGGGNQSLSLHLKNPEGKEYVMRSLQKSATQYIQAFAFKNQYMGDSFQNTKVEELLMDVFTGSHPFAPFTTADMSDALGILHTNPKLVYVEKQKSLGKFNNVFGGGLYMIEEKATDGHGDLESFANADKVISTTDVFRKIQESDKNKVDQKAYLRARLFDMVLGDWDRHQDQWRWAVIKNGEGELYQAFPRDRDQVFSNMADGWLMGFLTAAIPDLRLMQRFEAEPRSIKWFNVEPYPLDVAFLPDMTRTDWENEIAFIRQNLTDAVIERAITENFPPEARDETMQKIISVVKARRDNLPKYGMEYFHIVNKISVITGTDKDDYFEIVRNGDGTTDVSVYRIIQGEKQRNYHHKKFHPGDTAEIWLYGLDDKDVFEVTGNGKTSIKLRLIGGQNKDTYRIENGKKVIIYDYKSKESTFETKKGTKHLTDNYKINNYDYKLPKYSRLISAIPALGYNPDNGVMIGPQLTYTINKFVQNPFTQRHRIHAKFLTATAGVEAGYTGEFARVAGNANLVLDIRYRSPFYSSNFFGYGMSSAYDKSLDFSYYRTLVEEYRFRPSLKWNGFYGQYVTLGLQFQNIKTDRTPDRFVGISSQIDPASFTSQRFAGVHSKFAYDISDNKAFPTLALTAELEAGYTANIDRGGRNYFYINPKLGFSQRLNAGGDVVFGVLWQGQINSSEDVEFYQMANIGASKGLRGYRNERFAGQYAFTQTTDLRWQIGSFNSRVIPFSYGIYGGFDFGRVWTDFDPTDRWANSYGGGVFINGMNMMTLNASLFGTNEGARFAIGFGFGF